MKKRFRIGELLFLSAASDGDVVSIYRPTSKCRHYRDILRDGSKRELRLAVWCGPSASKRCCFSVFQFPTYSAGLAPRESAASGRELELKP